MMRSSPETPPAASSRQGLIGRRPRLTLALTISLSVAVTICLQARPAERTRVTLTPVVAEALNAGGAPSLGAGSANVTIVVFTDYQCAVCKRTDGALEALAAADPDVRILYKDWPILGEASVAGARVALAAHRQGKYLAVHRALMANRVKLNGALAEQLAIGAGADARRLRNDAVRYADEIDRQLGRQAHQAWSLGLGGTPGYLVGPFLIRGGMGERDLQRAVAAARRAGPPR